MTHLALFGGTPALQRREHASWPQINGDDRDAVLAVLDRGVLSGGSAPETVALENEFARYVGADFALLTGSGTSALQLALAASGVRAGDHVVVPAYSFVATALAALNLGAIPIFVDVDRETGAMCPRATARAITQRTRALVPVHIHGAAIDLGPFFGLASKHGLQIVEDAAQAHGAMYCDRAVGPLGAAGAFSLQSSKNLSAGEGGILVTNQAEIAEAAHRIRNFGQDTTLADRNRYDAAHPLDGDRPLTSRRIGAMYRGSELMAALARTQLRRLPAATERAQKNAERLTRALSKLPGVTPTPVASGCTSVHHKFRVRLDPKRAGVALAPRDLRDVMLRALAAEGLEVVLWQVAPLPTHGVFQEREGFGHGWPWSSDSDSDFDTLYDSARFENAQALLDESLVLFSQSCPLIAQSAETVDRYVDVFARVWEQRKALEEWHQRERSANCA